MPKNDKNLQHEKRNKPKLTPKEKKANKKAKAEAKK